VGFLAVSPGAFIRARSLSENMDYIEYEIADERATITLSYPEYRNALTFGMAEEIKEVVDEVEESDARCLVLQGSEGTFCAGGDIESMMEGMAGGFDAESLDELIEDAALPVNRTVQRVYECDVPTIARVEGSAYGAGATLAIACDVVLASEEAVFNFGFRRIGLSVDSGTSYLLPRAVGEKRAMDLVYSGDVIDAERAEEIGLISRAFSQEEFDERVDEYVDNIANGPTVALSHSKQFIQGGINRSFDEVIEAEKKGLRACFTSEDFREGVNAFLGKEEPEFSGE
jgi:2-(1,2-epoxy-1,2-dihydrophenyl)acetyl-CoA isomerase